MNNDITGYVGLDVHKNSIAVAVAAPGRAAPRFVGTTGPRLSELCKALSHVGKPSQLHLAYEAGPCGYTLARELIERGYRCEVEDGEIVGHGGAWLAGRHGARPGLIMPESAFIVGQRYFQEMAPQVALDRAEHVEVGLEVVVPAGHFRGCVAIDESSPLESGTSHKVYCRHVGLVIDDDLELTAIYEDGDDDDHDGD